LNFVLFFFSLSWTGFPFFFLFCPGLDSCQGDGVDSHPEGPFSPLVIFSFFLPRPLGDSRGSSESVRRCSLPFLHSRQRVAPFSSSSPLLAGFPPHQNGPPSGPRQDSLREEKPGIVISFSPIAPAQDLLVFFFFPAYFSGSVPLLFSTVHPYSKLLVECASLFSRRGPCLVILFG